MWRTFTKALGPEPSERPSTAREFLARFEAAAGPLGEEPSR